ncbi:MAG TPA: AraC family transcriptional regulator, partial [Nitratifractor sp.]|nr:AraC family transcriptional regulator [Nitratifractor sp.]
KKIFPTNTFVTLSPNIIKNRNLYQKLTTIYSSLQNSDNAKREIEQFATTLFKNYCQQAQTGCSDKRSNTLLQKIENYIIENIEEAISIDEIAETTGYSTAHLNRLFKEKYGLTLHAFLIDQRIHKAKELLSTNRQITLTEIAYKVGFYDQSHFIKNFKKAYSLSPKKYK